MCDFFETRGEVKTLFTDTIATYKDHGDIVSNLKQAWREAETAVERGLARQKEGLAEESLEVHPDDIAAWGLDDGELCSLSSDRGSIEILVRATTRSPRGTVFTSFSFNDVPVNILTGSGYDPITDTAELKVCPVRVEPIGGS